MAIIDTMPATHLEFAKDPNETRPEVLWAEIERLHAMAYHSNGTLWQELAIEEKMKRIKMEAGVMANIRDLLCSVTGVKLDTLTIQRILKTAQGEQA
ncbi:hypothetical protein BcepSauron_365 [Burkholderia phage BcepSauron]|uniref:Uncharacterized protein n=2 Tax=Sarumanvirus TaxID=2843450 RepID=A0A482MM47_9CAUD|nr:hypothetical protein H1O16_gp362 [Burkholderia phage BcepSaruman]YP_009904743.1 hypothetical protein H1O17_gp365 [Burkholderia phage BcepSauron]QBQ74745.1 hypothetical protein BcepSauron_365 [Burkholderia phage BcepSauron]QBX06775.1 hypothetical protein BcepSaruman_362 [Burkholderia phage BcepSaruman]